jgi:hypothetical protein
MGIEVDVGPLEGLSAVERAGGAIDHVVNGLSEFCDLLARL